MKIYIYSKITDDINIFKDLIEIVKEKDKEVYISTEHKRSFRELDRIKETMGDRDVLLVASLKSLGMNQADIANQLEYFVNNKRYLVIADIESTYQYGVSQPMNAAILKTLLDSMLLNNKNILEFQKKKSNAGRNKIEFPDNWEELYEKWENGNLSSKDFIEQSGLKKATFYNMVTDYKELLKANDSFIKKYKLG